MILTFIVIIRGIRKTIKKHNQEIAEKDKFDSAVKKYKRDLCDYGLEHKRHIYSEIEKAYKNNEREKEIHIKAFEKAIDQYPGDLKEIGDYKNDFDACNSELQNYLKIWRDDDNFQKISESNYGKYKNIGLELYKFP